MARADGTLLQPGDLFYHPEVRAHFPKWLAPDYWERNAHRPPVAVILPDASFFLVDGLHISTNTGYGTGYQVSGEAPQLTLGLPITDHGSGWRGTLVNGVLEWDELKRAAKDVTQCRIGMKATKSNSGG